MMFKQLCRLQRYTFLHDLPNVYNTFLHELSSYAYTFFRTSDQDIEHNFEFGRPVMFFMVKKMGKNENQGNTALQQSGNPSDRKSVV